MGKAIAAGSSSSLAQNVLLDLRTSAGAPATGIAFGAVTLKTIFDDDADNPITETLVDGTLGSFVSNGFKEAAAGGFQYSIPDARVATAERWFTIEVTASGILVERYRVWVYDPEKGLGAPTNLDAAISEIEGGAGGTVQLNVVASVASGGRIVSGPLYAEVDSADVRTIILQDEFGDPIDVSGKDLIFVVEDTDRNFLFSKTSADGITVGGAGNNEVSIAYTRDDTVANREGKHLYSLRNNTGENPEGKGWAKGPFSIDYSPRLPAEL